jgi:hypothetical protein
MVTTKTNRRTQVINAKSKTFTNMNLGQPRYNVVEKHLGPVRHNEGHENLGLLKLLKTHEHSGSLRHK